MKLHCDNEFYIDFFYICYNKNLNNRFDYNLENH